MNIVIDIGGTNTRIATTDLNTLGAAHKSLTSLVYKEAIDQIISICQELATGKDINNICIGLPGITDKTNSIIERTPNLPLWEGQNLRQDLIDKLGCNVLIQNDSALSALAEARELDPEGKQIIAYLGIGTGVGGARITHGQIDVTHYGFEPGHQIIDSDDLTTLESQIGGGDIQKAAGLKIAEITDSEFWDTKHYLAAVGIYNTILHWSPDTVILGGGMINKGSYKIDILNNKLNNINQLLPTLPTLHQSNLGDDSGLIGAMLYIKDHG